MSRAINGNRNLKPWRRTVENRGNTCALMPYYGLFDAIKSAAGLGFKVFELPGDRPHAWPIDRRNHQRQEIRNFLKEHEIVVEIVTIDGSYRIGPGLCSEDKDVRNDIFSHIQDLIQLGSDFGCSKFIMLPGRPLITTPVQRARELAVSALGDCADFAKNYGITSVYRKYSICLGISGNPREVAQHAQRCLRIESFGTA